MDDGLEPGGQHALSRLGVSDALVLRRVAEDRFVAVGGLGLGERWAGAVEVRPSETPLLRRALVEGGVVRASAGGDRARRVLGPLWAADAALIAAGRGVVVVLLSAQGHVAGDDATLLDAAEGLAATHRRVPPRKRLADELAALQALQRLLASAPADVREAAEHVLEVSAEALGCARGVLVLPRRRVAVVRGTTTAVGEAVAAQLLAQGPPVLAQDVVRAGVLDAGSADALGARSLLALPVTDDGLLLLVHTEPRGFTHRDQQLGRRLAAAAETVLLTAQQREDLQRQIALASVPERRDGLTGLGNRVGFDAALARRREGRTAAAVMVLAVGGLDAVTGELGEHAGDELLRAAAEIITDSVRSVDEVARVSDDEIAVLLAGADDPVCAWVQARIADAADRHPLMGELPLSLSAGWAPCRSDGGPDGDAAALELARARARQRAETF